MSTTSVLLPEPDTPVTQVNTPSGNWTVMFLRLFSAAFTTVIARSDRLRVFGTSMKAVAGKVLAGERRGDLLDLFGRALGDDLAAVHARRPGPMSITWSAARIVSSSCSTTSTVLPRSRSRKSVSRSLLVVALVQADAGFVEDIQHAHQGRADLGGQPDALAFAAGEGGRARSRVR